VHTCSVPPQIAAAAGPKLQDFWLASGERPGKTHGPSAELTVCPQLPGQGGLCLRIPALHSAVRAGTVRLNTVGAADAGASLHQDRSH